MIVVGYVNLIAIYKNSVVTVVLRVVYMFLAYNSLTFCSFSLKSTEAYSSTDNFGSRIPVCDWLIFGCGNSILHPKKEMKIIKVLILW